MRKIKTTERMPEKMALKDLTMSKDQMKTRKKTHR